MSTPDVSVIILSYNTKDLTIMCLKTLMASRMHPYTMEVIVVDNASDDGTMEAVKKTYPDVIRIVNTENLGFARGNNIGMKQAQGRYILLLNSDTEVEPDAVSCILQFMDQHPRAGAATAKLVLPDGTMDPACHRGFPTPWAACTYFTKLEALFPKTKVFGGYHLGYEDLNVAHEVDAISGAFFMVRRDVIDTVGLLDEDFFMYGEDLDWAYRMKESGWQIWFDPSVSVLHRKKKSGRSHTDRKRRITMERSFLTTMRLFYKKHYEKKYGILITNLVYMGIQLKLAALRLFGI